MSGPADAGRAMDGGGEQVQPPLAGLRVVELAYVMAGPVCGPR